LLVVIGIIALLISILLPALSKARKSSNTVKCLANHKQLMAAFIIYANEWKGAIPWPNYDGGSANNTPQYGGWLYNASQRVTTANWDILDLQAGQLWPTLITAKAYRCPEDSGPWNKADIQLLTTYIMNGCLASSNNYTWQTPPNSNKIWNLYKITQFKSDTAVFWEIGNGTLPGGQKNDGSNHPDEGITVKHSKGTTISFMDGHAEVWSLDTYMTQLNMLGGSMGGSRLWRDPSKADGGQGSKTFKALPSPQNPVPANTLVYSE
jgi:prepilin-type processing-associated H-X9-DG protein